MNINHNAPVISRGEITINAPIETVWDIMADIDNWPRWNHDVEEARLDGPLEPGSRLTWKAGPGTIKSELQDVERPNRIAWTGTTLGIKAVHVWVLAEQDGKTTVTTEESWEGLPVRLFKKASQKQLDQAIGTGLNYLRAEVEK